MNFSYTGGPSPLKLIFVLAFCFIAEALLFSVFFTVYTETIGLMSDVYLSELPIIGGIFGLIDENMNVGHLLAFTLALFSCGVPIYIAKTIIEDRIYENPQEWLSKPLNRITAIVMLFVFLIIFALETVNLMTLIIRQGASYSFVQDELKGLQKILAENKGLALLCSFLIALMNTLIAFFTAKTAHNLKQAWKESTL